MARSTRLRIVSALGLAATGLAMTACLPEGSLDATRLSVKASGNTLSIEGWAWDPDVPARPIDVHIYVDDAAFAVRASLPRPDVAATTPGAGPNHGFKAVVNVAAGRHRVCAYGIDSTGPSGGNTKLGCREVVVRQPRPSAPSTTSTTSTTSTPSSVDSAATWQTTLAARIDEVRTAAGLGSLESCAPLANAAQSYADTMAGQQWFDQTGPDGSEPWTRVQAYGGATTGENLSYGFDRVSKLIDAQLAAADQRANLLRPEFTHIGVGRTQVDPDGAGPTAPTYYWAVELGAGGTC
jgi:uncharacterized protein YkwD